MPTHRDNFRETMVGSGFQLSIHSTMLKLVRSEVTKAGWARVKTNVNDNDESQLATQTNGQRYLLNNRGVKAKQFNPYTSAYPSEIKENFKV